jgi:putative transposase
LLPLLTAWLATRWVSRWIRWIERATSRATAKRQQAAALQSANKFAQCLGWSFVMIDAQDKIVYAEWAHAPSHLFSPNTAYIVTAGTYQKTLFFDTPEKRDFLLQSLFDEAKRFEWKLQAWAVMANHYHFVALAPGDPKTLARMVKSLHSKTAIELNKRDNTPGRKVWFQYRDTCLTNERSYFARLNYVHHNPVKHGVTQHAEDYRWCSLGWFMRETQPAFQRTVLSFAFDQVKMEDQF